MGTQGDMREQGERGGTGVSACAAGRWAGSGCGAPGVPEHFLCAHGQRKMNKSTLVFRQALRTLGEVAESTVSAVIIS